MSLLRILLCCSPILALMLTGCSDEVDANRKPTKPVAVTVTYRGAPVEGAIVSFIDESGTNPAYGMTDAQGVAKMKTYEEGDGAVYGTHKVTIVKTEVTGGAPVADQDTEAYVPPEMQAGPGPEVKHHVPLKYGSPATSGLTAEVSESSPEQIPFELTD